MQAGLRDLRGSQRSSHAGISLVWRKAIGRFACSINAQAFAERIRIRAVFRNVEKRFVEVEGSLVEATKREVLHWAVGEQGRRVDNLTCFT
jgi:hypothetical protein